jgi:hypothetical protein
MMAKKEKKVYVRPELTSRKIELGVYGNYDGGDATEPLLPIDNQGRKGDPHLNRM